MTGARAGLAARETAARALDDILTRRIAAEAAISAAEERFRLDPRDHAFAVNIVLTTLRRLGQIDEALARHLERPLPRKSGLAVSVLRTAAAQMLFLATPPHAAIGLAVETARQDRHAGHFAGVINAVLRRVGESRDSVPAIPPDVSINTPSWLWKRWTDHYGEATAARLALAHLEEPTIDIAVKSDGERWAEALSAKVLLPDHLRLPASVPAIPALPGFSTGDWWVQDVAASLPVRLLGDVRGKRVLDLCAAPGGKTLQLCSRGAVVTAVDVSEARLDRLRENLSRTGLKAEVVCADVRSCGSGQSYDAVLLDAPCSATGTIRRHPEIPHIRAEADIRRLARQQAELLRQAVALVAPGGTLVFSTCSLEPEEGESVIEDFLGSGREFEILTEAFPISAIPLVDQGRPGCLRTMPDQVMGGSRGMDGFFAAALRRVA